MRHNSENNSGFGRDLRKWVDKESVLPGNCISVPVIGKNMGHPAVFPPGVPEFFIKLFTQEGDKVLDPFGGSGTTGVAALNLLRNVVLIDTKPEYYNLMKSTFDEFNDLFTAPRKLVKDYNAEEGLIKIAKEQSLYYGRL